MSRAQRVINTYEDRPSTTGVLLEGIKGSGKSLLSKVISAMTLETGLPTVIVSAGFKDDGFQKLIEAVGPAVILFDEFEKVYPQSNDQEALLTLLDGLYSSKKLFIFTVNSVHKVSEFLKNRPGRIFYKFTYKNLEEDFVREYCNDRLANKDWVEQIVHVSQEVFEFSIDMLQAIVEESNRYAEAPKDFVEILNIEMFRYKKSWSIKFTPADGQVKTYLDEYSRVTTNCDVYLNIHAFDEFGVNYYLEGVKDDDGDYEFQHSTFHQQDMKSFHNKQYTFVNADGDKAVLSEKVFEGPSMYTKYMDLL